MNTSFEGHDAQTNRKLFLCNLPAAGDAPTAVDFDGRYFVALIVWNANNATDAEVTGLSRKLIDAGCELSLIHI